jgi:hypothetical protein
MDNILVLCGPGGKVMNTPVDTYVERLRAKGHTVTVRDPSEVKRHEREMKPIDCTVAEWFAIDENASQEKRRAREAFERAPLASPGRWSATASAWPVAIAARTWRRHW